MECVGSASRLESIGSSSGTLRQAETCGSRFGQEKSWFGKNRSCSPGKLRWFRILPADWIRDRACSSVEEELELGRDGVGAALHCVRRILEDAPLVLDADVADVGRGDVVLQPARDPHLVAGLRDGGGKIAAELPHLELTEDGDFRGFVVIGSLSK